MTPGVRPQREGAEATRPLASAGGTPPQVDGLLERVQIDHTVVDVMVVDERHRLPIGRPHVTAAIDVATRCIVGLMVTNRNASRNAEQDPILTPRSPVADVVLGCTPDGHEEPGDARRGCFDR